MEETDINYACQVIDEAIAGCLSDTGELKKIKEQCKDGELLRALCQRYRRNEESLLDYLDTLMIRVRVGNVR